MHDGNVVDIPESTIALAALAGEVSDSWPEIPPARRHTGMLSRSRWNGNIYMWDESARMGYRWRLVRIVKGV